MLSDGPLTMALTLGVAALCLSSVSSLSAEAVFDRSATVTATGSTLDNANKRLMRVEQRSRALQLDADDLDTAHTGAVAYKNTTSGTDAPATEEVSNSSSNVVADASKNGMKCGKPGNANRLFDLRKQNGTVTESACIVACEHDPKCVAFSGVMGSWCIGCQVDLDTAHAGAVAYKKTTSGMDAPATEEVSNSSSNVVADPSKNASHEDKDTNQTKTEKHGNASHEDKDTNQTKTEKHGNASHEDKDTNRTKTEKNGTVSRYTYGHKDQLASRKAQEEANGQEGSRGNFNNIPNLTFVDPYVGKVKKGFCSNWQEGSSLRALGESNSFYGAQNRLSGPACISKCEDDKACEQAMYDEDTMECWLGINSMFHEPKVAKATKNILCYGKKGFDYRLQLHVKDGWCSDFQEGWGGELPSQCDLLSNTLESQQSCSHWGAEYGLSERGCWVKCQENFKCTQAVYENKEGAWSCFIGTGTMTTNPGPSRCSDCNNKCFDPHGFSK